MLALVLGVASPAIAASAKATSTHEFGERQSGGVLSFGPGKTDRSRRVKAPALNLGSAVVANRGRQTVQAPARTTSRQLRQVRGASIVVPTTGRYSRQVSEEHPTAVVVIADLSGSMGDEYGEDGEITRADAMVDAVNETLKSIVTQARGRRGVRNFIDVAVIGAADLEATDFLNGSSSLNRHSFVPTSELATMPQILNDEPVWVEAELRGANGDVQAFEAAHSLLAGWTLRHPHSFPPTVINVTDGFAVDGDPAPHARKIMKDVGTTDGNALVYNIHIGSGRGKSIIFPDSEDQLPNEEAKALFRISSVLPPAVRAAARAAGFHVTDASRGFAYDASMPVLMSFMKVGSQVVR